jgi:hypothetical protein
VRRPIPIVVSLAVVLAACGGTEPTTNTGTGTTPPPTGSSDSPPGSAASPTQVPVSPTPPATPASPPPTRGSASASCANGWVTPDETTSRFTEPLGIVRRTTGIAGPLVVVEMRYFTGAESPPSEQGYILEVERWYIKLYAADDLAFQGRFLVEGRGFGRGVAAVAPYDTSGFRSPDWRGFQYEVGAQPKAVPGLPGSWLGTEYDFVRGGEGIKVPGLPAEVRGCLDGT